MPDSVPARVREELAALPGPKREAFHEAYRQQARSAPTAYALCLLVGGQYGYVGRWGLQILFWVTLGGLMVWWIVDLFRIPGMVRRYNERFSNGNSPRWKMNTRLGLSAKTPSTDPQVQLSCPGNWLKGLGQSFATS